MAANALNKQEIVRCPLCGEVTIRQEFDFWKCPICGCEIWPEEEETERQKNRVIREVYYEELRIGFYGNPKGRSSRSKKYGRKKVFKLPAERYTLC